MACKGLSGAPEACYLTARHPRPHLLVYHQPRFDFQNGDVLVFKDEGANAVIHIESITYECSGTVPILMHLLLNMHCIEFLDI